MKAGRDPSQARLDTFFNVQQHLVIDDAKAGLLQRADDPKAPIPDPHAEPPTETTTLTSPKGLAIEVPADPHVELVLAAADQAEVDLQCHELELARSLDEAEQEVRKLPHYRVLAFIRTLRLLPHAKPP